MAMNKRVISFRVDNSEWVELKRRAAKRGVTVGTFCRLMSLESELGEHVIDAVNRLIKIEKNQYLQPKTEQMDKMYQLLIKAIGNMRIVK